MEKGITPTQVRCVLAVADTLHFGEAAAGLRLAQSALSAQVARLEADLGVRLFERTSRSVSLTAAGAAFLPRARTVLAELDRLRTDVVAAGGQVEGLVRIGTISTLVDVDLAGLLATLRVRHPRLRAQVHVQASERTVADVAAGRLDLGFTGTRLGESLTGVEIAVLTTEPLLLALPPEHPLRHRRRVRLADLAGEPMVDFVAGTGGRRQTDEAFAAAGVTRDVVVEASSGVLLLDLVRQGVGLGFVPASLARSLVCQDVTTVPVTDAPVRRVSVVHAGANSSAATRAVLVVLRDALSTTTDAAGQLTG
ncbi:LysR family transcriptional regulator [Kineococcus gynurae]|uniref:LysR family transcriptional regulator n=1 Tax=Kineococcus gynurae TaxID=452979 RepID=UPI0035E5EFC3